MDKRTIFFVLLLASTFYFIQFIFPPAKVQPAKETVSKEQTTAIKSEVKPLTKRSFPKTGKQTYYVIENEFQQLVFSSTGGALCEINLPFKSKTNSQSVVNEIDFDREMKDTSEVNATFPLHPYNIFENNKIEERNGKLSGYYPLIRRQIIGSNENILPKYYSLNLVSETEDLENANYELVRLDKDLIQFELVLPSKRILKTYQFSKEAPYTFDLSISIEGDAKGLWLTTGIPEVELTSGKYEPILKIKTSNKNKDTVDKISLPKTQTTVSTVYPDWICNSNGFLGIILDPLTEIASGYKCMNIAGNLIPTRISLIDSQYHLYPADKYPGYEMFLPLKSASQKYNFRVFAGPLAKDILSSVDETYSNAITGYNPNYVAARSFQGFFAFISEPFAKLMFSLMQVFYKITHSWGFSIILLTLVLRIMLYPLNAWTIKSQMKMQELSPKIQAIQKKHAKNPQKAKIEVMNLYREKGTNPLLGCFPLIIQLPFLIGMFDLLKSTFELRGASFIPGWITNLTAPDVLFSWSMPIPLIGRQFHLLPIIMGVVMFLQSKFSTPKPVDGQMTDQQKQQQVMTTIMPIVFTIIFYKMPSGLNIYYLFFSLFGILQQWIMNKTAKKKLMKI
ncbi:MAG: membrane protein insertase YidC [Parachlamydiales bacterium]|jgi:YidC/Oxa1 family membrane protein insertase